MSCIEFREDTDRIAWLTIDQSERETNRIDTAFIDDLEAVFSKVEAEVRLQGVVFMSGKNDSFLLGWDLDELEAARDSEKVRMNSRRMQRLLNRIAGLDVPTVAAIHGTCLGGGFELAIACHLRVASDHEKTVFGLPEVRLGLIPCCGGTQRLPGRIGLEDSLDLILNGRELRIDQAGKMGLLESIVPRENLKEEARRLVLSNHGIQRTKKSFFEKINPASKLTCGRVFEKARESTARKFRGDNPALFRIIDVLERGIKEGMESGLAMEARVFGDLAISRPARNLLFIEKMKQENATYSGPWTDGSSEREIRLMGVVGEGGTGVGIIYLLTDKEIRTRFKEVSPEGVSKVFQRIASLHHGQNREKGPAGKLFERKMDTVTGTTDYRGFGRADLIIDTSPEEKSAKKLVFKELEERIDKSCVIATTISSLSLFDLASDMLVPTRLVGLHLFHPIHTMPLLEIIEGEWTDRYATRTAFNLSRKLGKIPIVVKDTPGFLVNRIRMALINESFLLLEEGLRVEAVDQALVDFGFHLGPFQLIDGIGFEVASKVASAMKESFGSRLPISKALQAVLNSTRQGGIHSFYIDEEDGSVVNPQLYIEIGRSPETGEVPGSLKIQKRLLNAMINEAVICLEDEVVGRPEDVELGTVLGMGFPSFRGGLLRYADQHGIRRVVDELERQVEGRGGKRQPADTLVKMAKEGRRFF